MIGSSQAIDPQSIDREIIRILRRHGCLTRESICYLLQPLPELLVKSSLQRLLKSEAVGYSLLDGNSFPQGESESIEEIPPGGILSKDDSNSPWGNYRVKACLPRGTAKTDHEYYSVYLGDTEVAYLGGGNTDSPVAQRRKAEFELLVERGVITPETSAEQVRYLVRGIQCRNLRSSTNRSEG